MLQFNFVALRAVPIRPFLFLILLCFGTPLFAQEVFQQTPAGPQFFEQTNDQMVIRFEKGIDYSTQKALLSEEKLLAPITEDQLLPAPAVTMVDLVPNVSSKEASALLQRLREMPQITWANPVVRFADGTKQVLQDEILVKLRNQQQLAELRNMAKAFQLQLVRENEFDRGLWHVRVTKNSPGDALSISNALYETGLFEYAEPDWLRFMKKRNTNDTYINYQWSLNNTGSSIQYNGTSGMDMSVFDAWTVSTGSSSIKVAILDEGVDLTHPDLVGNMLGGYDATGQGSGGNPSGDDAHGTACAGIVAAVGNNNLGTAGVAYNCKIVPVRIAYSNSNGDWVTSNTWIANSINWSWQTAGADVLSNSWGGGSYSSTIVSAINGAVNSGRGGLGAPVLFAAGNDNTSLDFPGNQTPTIAVAAMSMCEERKNPSSCDGESWWGSNYGTGLDIAAPGVKIACSDISGSAGYSSGDYTLTFNGTSSACPNAAGVMALILSVNPALTETQARAAIESTCDKVGGYTYNSSVSGQPNGTWSNDLGYGRVNAMAAVQSVQSSTPNDAGISAIAAPNGTVCGTSVSAQVTLRNFGSNTLSSATINYRIDAGTTYTYNWSGSLASGGTASVALPAIGVSSGSHTFTAYTSSPNGQSDSDTGNDQSQSSFDAGTNALTLALTLDDYGSETTWAVENSSSVVVASGGPYSNNQGGTVITENICVADGCFDFIIYDSYGDGICCSYGNGSYSLTEDASGTTLASGASFTNDETTNFCVPTTTNPPVQASISSSNDVSCNGGNDGSATASASSGTTPYTYNWSNGGSSATASSLGAGSYTVTVTDNAGTTATASVSIGQPSALSLSHSSTAVSCNGGNDGSVNLTVSGGTSPYTYSWSNGPSTQDISSLSAGSYTVTVTDNNGCADTRTASVSQPSALSVGLNITDVTVQGGSDGSIAANVSGGTGAYTYNWSNGANSATASNLSAGTYTVTATDNNGCTATASGTVQDGAPSGGCSSTVSSFPYSEGFESGLGGWTQNSGDDLDWTRQSGSTPSSSTGPSSAASGTYYLYVEASSPNYPSKTAIITGPCFDLSGLSSPELAFDYHMYGSAMGSLSLEVSTNGGSSWSSAIWSQSGNQGNSWNAATVDLSAYAGSTIALRFVGVTGTSYTSDMSIDNLSISEPAASYCASGGGDSSYEWIQSVTVGSLSNTSGNDGGYGDYTGQSATLNAGSSVSVSLAPGFSSSTYVEYWRIWIDFNKDGDFTDANEEVFAPASSSSTVTGSFTVPSGVATGSTRMRIAMKWNAAPTSCESFNYGEVEDYTVVIGSAAKPGTIAANEDVAVLEGLLFPNPATNATTLQLSLPAAEQCEVMVVSPAGKVVAQTRIAEGNTNANINVAHLAAGIYIVHVRNAHTSFTKRLVIAD